MQATCDVRRPPSDRGPAVRAAERVDDFAALAEAFLSTGVRAGESKEAHRPALPGHEDLFCWLDPVGVFHGVISDACRGAASQRWKGRGR